MTYNDGTTPKSRIRGYSSVSACSIPASIATTVIHWIVAAHPLLHPQAGTDTRGNGRAGSSTSPPHQRPLSASSRLSAALQRAGADEHPGHDARVPAQHVPDGLAGSGASK